MRILTVRQLGGIGDCLMLTPVFRGLREKYPHAKIQHVTGEIYLGGALTDIFSHVPKKFIDELHPIEPFEATPERTRTVWSKHYGTTPALEDEMLWQRADLTFDLNTPCVDYEWAAMHSPEGIQKTRTQVWCDFVGVEPSSHKPMYSITLDERKKAALTWRAMGLNPAKCIGVGTSACDSKRALGQGKLQSICAGLQSRGWTPVVIDPTFKFEEFPSLNGKRISELMALIEPMAAMVTADSGLLHMAGTLGVPVVGVFGPTDSRLRMQHYTGSAIDSSKLMPCAPCWYAYPCLQPKNGIPRFSCLNKIGSDVIVEEAVRWAEQRV